MNAQWWPTTKGRMKSGAAHCGRLQRLCGYDPNTVSTFPTCKVSLLMSLQLIQKVASWNFEAVLHSDCGRSKSER